MDDLISKQEVIKAVSELPTYYADSGGYYGGAQEPLEALLEPMDVINTIQSLPTIERIVITDALTVCVKQQWIPCSEKLPEVGQCVLCYLKGRHYMGKYRVCKYRDADKYVNHPYFDFNEDGFPKVLAWMPLPPCYKGDE